jgi:hypothetical protein
MGAAHRSPGIYLKENLSEVEMALLPGKLWAAGE